MQKAHIRVLLLSTFLLSGCVSSIPVSDLSRPQLDFEIRNNLLLIDAHVNDKWGQLIVDTGASISLLDYSQSKKYKFDYYPDLDSRLTGFGGHSQLMKTSELKLSLMGMENIITSFSASDLSGLNRILSASNQKIVGILGSDFLNKHGAIINYERKKIFLTKVAANQTTKVFDGTTLALDRPL